MPSYEEIAQKTVNEFNLKKENYKNLTREVEYILSEILDESAIEGLEVTSRVKSPSSIKKKIIRKRYNKPFEQMEDLAAVRVVCLFEPDLFEIEKKISETFVIKEVENKTKSLGDSSMGYQGIHLILTLGNNFQGQRYDRIKHIKCELQIRTILQDAWSKISHKLIYKSESSIPKPLKRSINNVSSLMEIAQSTFDNVRTQKEKYISDLETNTVVIGDLLSREINYHTLYEYSVRKFPDLRVLSHLQDQFIYDLNLEKYQTIKDIDVIVDKASQFIEKMSRENPNVFKYSTDFLTKSFGLLDEDFLESHRFSKSTILSFNKIRRNNNINLI